MINVVPINDEKPHVHDDTCWCHPKVETAHTKTKEPYLRGPLVIHNSEDCREVCERAIGEGVSRRQKWGVFAG